VSVALPPLPPEPVDAAVTRMVVTYV